MWNLRVLFSQYDLSSFGLHRRLRDATHGDRFRARMLLGLSIVCMIFVPIIYFYMLPSFYGTFITHSIGFALLFLGAFFAVILLRFAGSFRLAAAVLLGCPLLGLSLFAIMEGVAVSGTYFWFAGLGLFGLYVLGLRIGKYWCFVVLILQLSLIQNFKDSPDQIPVGMSREDFVNIFWGDVLGVTLGIWTIAALYELQRKRFERDLKLAQAEILQHREKLMRDARLTELGQMAGGVAHEINNPLAIVHGYTVRLRRELEKAKPLSDEQKAMFASIERSCHRISTISRALLSYAHEGSYEQDVVFSLHKLKEECLELCQERMHSRDITLHVEASNLEQKISGKYVKLLQIIVNLLNNAIDAVTSSDEKWIRLELSLDGQELHVAVEDSGAGIPEHLRERIKSPFFTTKPIGKGTGLGLSIVDGIIRDMDGEFFLDTKAPHTRFVVRFPLALVITEP
ncbi:MAG TPA: ATP-binding protein [Oligoflexus sp.]|uniref:sensor histidine kinase n=1 Tax=Oligoflexus sp. TaxID=1971216 RepID=UPI002D7F4645|nr:ATP-binding protein [Oligoflexus sp.]HET9237415.1 ATP-binding protein [Oligoflexus sp.]